MIRVDREKFKWWIVIIVWASQFSEIISTSCHLWHRRHYLTAIRSVIARLMRRWRTQEDLGERLGQNGLQLRHDCFDIRRDYVGIERSLVRPPLERQKAARLAYDFHQRVDQAT